MVDLSALCLVGLILLFGRGLEFLFPEPDPAEEYKKREARALEGAIRTAQEIYKIHHPDPDDPPKGSPTVAASILSVPAGKDASRD